MTETTSRVYNPNFKMACLTAVSGGHQEKKVYVNGRTRKVTPLEYERLQTVPDCYTASESDSQRYKMLGNGWTVDVIAHIFKGLK
jgi:DNA (cytosine-5)-methyltransferase 3A